MVNLHEFLVPFLDVSGLLARVGIIVLGGLGIVLVVLAPFDDLLQDRLVDLGSEVLDTRVRWSGAPLGRLKSKSLREPTLGIGTAVEIASSPRSSIIFLMSMERSATCRSICRVAR